MPKLEELEKWIRESFRTQGEAAEKIGTTQTTISKWIGGKQRISLVFQKRLRKLGFGGLLDLQGAGTVTATREELAELRGEMRAEIRNLRDVQEKLGEALRALSLRVP